MKNKIITSEGNIQFVFGDSGKVINIHPFHIFTSFNEDTISFIQIALPKSSGLALMTSTAEDLEVNGSSYSFEQLKDVLAEEFAEAGAQARAEVVTQLPVTGKTNTIYLVPKAEGSGYDEYIYIKDENKWELLGDTDIELSRYIKKSDFNTYSAETKTVIDSKQDTLIAGDNIAISGNVISATQVQSDWNENNSGATAYIKNRTHYTYEGYADERTLSSDTSVEIDSTHYGLKSEWVGTGFLESGKQYRVTIGEDEYVVTATTLSNGNVALNVEEGAESPLNDTWSIYRDTSDANWEATVAINDSSLVGQPISVKVEKWDDIVVPLENKYLGLPISGNTDNRNIIANYFNNSISNDCYGCFAEGTSNTISGSTYSHAEGGYNTISNSNNSHVEGDSNTISSSSYRSHTEGSSNKIISGSYNSHAEGYGNTISSYSYYSHAEGQSNTISDNSFDSHTEGGFNTINGNSYYSHTEGSYNTISSDSSNSHVEGNNNTISGNSEHSHAEGEVNIIINSYDSHAEGYGNKIISGSNCSHAEGYYNTISSGSQYSHAEGLRNTISGGFSHAEGNNTKASGDSSHAEGASTEANDYASHAEGVRTKANGYASHAEGSSTEASGYHSHAEGNSTKANGYYSHAEGDNTVANNYSEHASGKHNNSVSASTIFGNSGNTLFSVGNGYAANKLHNAFEIRQSGDIYIANTNASGEYYAKPMIKLQDIISQLETRIQALENGNS